MTDSAEGIVEEAETLTGVVRKIITTAKSAKLQAYSVTRWERDTKGCDGFL